MKKTDLNDRPRTAEETADAERQIVELAKRIEFYPTEYSIELLAEKMRRGEFVVPRYQREFTWELERKSRFIESLLMGLPIPFLIFWEMPNGYLEIVDGSQRLRTIEEFQRDSLRLGELSAIPSLSHSSFSDLLPSRRLKFNNRSIRGIVLNEHADEQARFDMFERINTGSKIANFAEVRRGALAGDFMTMITDLAQDKIFAKLTPMSTRAVAEREREELVTRFFAYGDGLEGYRDRPSEFIYNYVKQMNDKASKQPELVALYQRRFIDMVAFVARTLPFGFGRNKGAKATPRARFEALSIGSSRALERKPELHEQTPNVDGWLTDETFRKVTGSDGANAIARLKERIEFVEERLLNG